MFILCVIYYSDDAKRSPQIKQSQFRISPLQQSQSHSIAKKNNDPHEILIRLVQHLAVKHNKRPTVINEVTKLVINLIENNDKIKLINDTDNNNTNN